MWQENLQDDLKALAEKYGLSMMAFAGTVPDTKQALIMIGGNYDQLVYGMYGMVEKISLETNGVLPEDIIADLTDIVEEQRG